MTSEQIRLEIQLEVKRALADLGTMSEELKRLAGEAKKFIPPANDIKSIMGRLDQDLKTSAKAASLFGDELGGLRQRQASLKTVMVQLLEQGLEPQSEEIQKMKAEYDAAGEQMRFMGYGADGLAGQLGHLVGAIGAAAALRKVTQFAGESVVAFNSAEASALRLQISMEMRGVQGGAQRMKTFASEMQGMAGVSDDLVKQLAAQLIQEGKSEAQTRDLISAAVNMQAVYGGDLSTHVNSLSTSLSGQARSLGMTIPAIKDLTEEQLRSGEAIKIVSTLFDGYAERMSGSGAVAMSRMEESIGDVNEALGEGLAPILTLGANLLNRIAVAAANSSDFMKGAMGAAVAALSAGLAVLAAKTLIAAAAKWTHFAALQAVNIAMSVANPLLIAGVVAAVAGAAAAVAFAAAKAKEARAISDAGEKSNSAISSYGAASEAMSTAAKAAKEYAAAIDSMSDAELRSARSAILAAMQRTTGMDALTVAAAKIKELDKELDSRSAAATATSAADAEKKAAAFKASWADFMAKSAADSSLDPFAGIDYERTKKLAEAAANGVGAKNKAIIDEINAYYDAKRSEVADSLSADETARMIKLSATKVDDIETEKAVALASLSTLEAKRIAAAGTTEAERMAITERYAAMRASVEAGYDKEIAETRVTEARAAAETSWDLTNAAAAAAAKLTESRLDDLVLERDRTLTLFGGTEDSKLALARGYARQIADLEIDEARRAADERIAQARRAFEEARRLAAEQGKWGEYAARSASDAVKDTEAGKMLGLGGQPAQAWQQVLIDSALSIAMQNEDVQKVMNIFSTIIKGVVEHVLPPLAKALTWLYDKVIVPVGNAIINLINSVIKALNKLPFVNIKLLETLKTTDQIIEAEKQIASKTQAVSDEMDRIRQVFSDRRKDIEDAYRKNVASLQKLLELGAMSESEYDRRIVAANVAKDVSMAMLQSAEERQVDLLEGILDRLNNGIDVSDSELVSAGVASTSSATTTSTTTPATTVPDLSALQGLNLTNIWAGIRFDNGTTSVPSDMIAKVHKGETIIPESFSSGLRSGKLSLSAGGVAGGPVEIYNISIYPKGSVLTRDDLVDEIQLGLEQKKKRGTQRAGVHA